MGSQLCGHYDSCLTRAAVRDLDPPHESCRLKDSPYPLWFKKEMWGQVCSMPSEMIESGSELVSIYYLMVFTDVGKPDTILRAIDLNQMVLRDHNVLHWREMLGGTGW